MTQQEITFEPMTTLKYFEYMLEQIKIQRVVDWSQAESEPEHLPFTLTLDKPIRLILEEDDNSDSEYDEYNDYEHSIYFDTFQHLNDDDFNKLSELLRFMDFEDIDSNMVEKVIIRNLTFSDNVKILRFGFWLPWHTKTLVIENIWLNNVRMLVGKFQQIHDRGYLKNLVINRIHGNIKAMYDTFRGCRYETIDFGDFSFKNVKRCCGIIKDTRIPKEVIEKIKAEKDWA